MSKLVYKVYDPQTGLYKNGGSRITWSPEGTSWNGIVQLKVHLRQMQTRTSPNEGMMVRNSKGFKFDPAWEIHTIRVVESIARKSKVDDFLRERDK